MTNLEEQAAIRDRLNNLKAIALLNHLWWLCEPEGRVRLNHVKDYLRESGLANLPPNPKIPQGAATGYVPSIPQGGSSANPNHKRF